jgi:hypothetical protein
MRVEHKMHGDGRRYEESLNIFADLVARAPGFVFEKALAQDNKPTT